MWTCLCARSVPITHGLSSLGTARPQSTPKTCVARFNHHCLLNLPIRCLFGSFSKARFGLPASQSGLLYKDQLLRIHCTDSHPHSCGLFFFCPRKVTFSSSASLCLFLLNNSLFFFHVEPEDFSLESTNLTPSVPICNVGIFYLLKHKLPLWSFSK